MSYLWIMMQKYSVYNIHIYLITCICCNHPPWYLLIAGQAQSVPVRKCHLGVWTPVEDAPKYHMKLVIKKNIRSHGKMGNPHKIWETWKIPHIFYGKSPWKDGKSPYFLWKIPAPELLKVPTTSDFHRPPSQGVRWSMWQRRSTGEVPRLRLVVETTKKTSLVVWWAMVMWQNPAILGYNMVYLGFFISNLNDPSDWVWERNDMSLKKMKSKQNKNPLPLNFHR